MEAHPSADQGLTEPRSYRCRSRGARTAPTTRLWRIVVSVAWVASAVTFVFSAEASPASAHQVPAGVRSVFDKVVPSVPSIQVNVVFSLAEQLVVLNPTATPLEILGNDGVPFIRVSSAGVDANLASPDWYETRNPGGIVELPPGTAAGASPRFVKVSSEPSWGWFDHRLHPASTYKIPSGASGHIRLAAWSIPMRYADQALAAEGHVEFVRLTGRLVPAFLPFPKELPAKDLTMQPSAGRVPSVFAEWKGSQTLTLLDGTDRPFIRLSPKGAEVDEASPTWALTAEANGNATADDMLGNGGTPRWKSVDTEPRITWLEPRAAFPQEEPDPEIVRAAKPAVVADWVVPAKIDDTPIELAGTTTWEPVASQGTGATGGGGPSTLEKFRTPVRIVGSLVAVGAGLLLVRDRLRKGKAKGKAIAEANPAEEDPGP